MRLFYEEELRRKWKICEVDKRLFAYGNVFGKK